jgi:DNA-binding transcriptional MerR regulator
MNLKKISIALLLVFGIVYSEAQTQEEMDKIKRLQDSMMNLPEMKDMMQQLQQMKEMQDKQQSEKKLTSSKVKADKPVQKKASSEDWFWENTMASTNNKFTDWKGGTANIAIAFKGPGLTVFNIGGIKEDGSIVFNLPDKFKTQLSLERQIGTQGLFYDIYDRSSVSFTNKDTGFITNASMMVMRNGNQIGNLTIGNSVRVTLNLVSQSGVDSGDEGYLLYWAYAQDNCALNGNQVWKGDVRKDGTNTIEVETNVNYNLNFKSGWNLVKTEVIGNYKLEHERGLDVTWFKNHEHSIISSIPNDARYFFRSIPQY